MGRLVVISNRMPLGDTVSGGLAVALRDQLTAHGGLWIGHNDEIVERPSERLNDIPGMPFERKGFDLTAEELDGYYSGFSNSVLWPLFHGRTDLLDVGAHDLDIYVAVNRRIARLAAAELQPDDRIWVQDYHLFPLAEELRKLGVENRIGHFLHIPFPQVQDCLALPDFESFAAWLAAYDLLGLQSRRDADALFEAFRQLPGAEVVSDLAVWYRGRTARVGAFPIGIDSRGFAETAARADDTSTRAADEQLMIGVDRLDYSKGLARRFRTFGDLLERRPDLAGKITLLQIAPPTRESVKAYQDIREELEWLTGHINGAHAKHDWTPIQFIHRSVPRDQLAGLYRAARIGLVTPLMDGMNLVAKEYVAAQDPDDPGVLILSKFAGAAEQLDRALIVNPHNPEEVIDAIEQALEMPLAERRERHAAMMRTLLDRDVEWWSNAYLSALDATQRAVPEPVLRAS